MAKHGIAESTKLYGCMNVSFVSTEDVDNGSIVANGGLATGYTDVYTASKPDVDDKVYIVIHPVYGYDERLEEEKNEDNYTNEAGKPFRAYELKTDRKFKVSSDMITPIDGSTPLAVGQYIVPSTGFKMKASSTPTNAIGKIVAKNTENVKTYYDATTQNFIGNSYDMFYIELL